MTDFVGGAWDIPTKMVMGQKDRSPGWCYKKNSDGSEKSSYLEYTNEMIHSSVCVRLQKPRDLGADGKADFAPVSLRGWTVPKDEAEP